ncbi:translation initiation factor eIF-2B subunit delta-like [Penaeus japonicus]|uniref:translation initiation factor eIF-2B subunit delta-like n=1 Tax=Penaeus japonicus TaxID=27405 RepID=UPI001C70C943|nr:translation initiation factor eIF-2B subunit delta-like [Penaeus japonicus]XP_042872508.1 translation initiation factor eIF-2B subunit delta-like [Penaeus japonicus]
MAPPGIPKHKRTGKAAKNRSSQTENHPDSELRRSPDGPPVERPASASCSLKASSDKHPEGPPKAANSPQGSPAAGGKGKESPKNLVPQRKGTNPEGKSAKRTQAKGSGPNTPRRGKGQVSSPAANVQISQSLPPTAVSAQSSSSVTNSTTLVKQGSEKSTETSKQTQTKSSTTCTSDSENKKLKMSDKKLDSLCQLLENIVLQHGGKEIPLGGTKPDNVAQQKQNVSAKEIPVTSTASNTSPIEVTVECPNEEKSREEIERERKARKEAKKDKKKKGGDQGKAKEGSTKESKKPTPQSQKGSNIQSKPAEEKAAPLQQSKQLQEPQPQQKEDGQDGSGKSKADLKRERREKQEAQRLAKAEAKAKQEAEKQKKSQPQSQKVNSEESKKAPQPKKKLSDGRRMRDKKSVEKEDSSRRIPLLGHLTPYTSHPPSLPVNCDSIHPAIRTLGQKMKDRVVDGSTARVIATLAALKRFINDYRTPESCDLSRDLAEKILPNVAYLHACRPLAIAMDNAVRFLKHKINSIEPNVPEAQAKDLLRTAIDEYVRDNINLASSTIATHAAQLLKDEDIILTFGYSALVCDMVEAAQKNDMNVRVVVADSPFPPTGSDMAKRLAAMNVPTYYRLITDVTHIMHKVTKVVVEAEAVMMNGAVQGMCGTAGLALAACTHDTPFIVLCHTYKFSNNDLTDSLVVNELGDASGIVSCPSREYCDLLTGWKETENLNVVRLVYDVTPASLVTALVTEQSVLPTSAVPVIIRRNYADILGQD